MLGVRGLYRKRLSGTRPRLSTVKVASQIRTDSSTSPVSNLLCRTITTTRLASPGRTAPRNSSRLRRFLSPSYLLTNRFSVSSSPMRPHSLALPDKHSLSMADESDSANGILLFSQDKVANRQQCPWEQNWHETRLRHFRCISRLCQCYQRVQIDLESDTCHILSIIKLLTLTSEVLKINNERNLYWRLNHGTVYHRVPVVNTIINWGWSIWPNEWTFSLTQNARKVGGFAMSFE